jgi:hypothetical protein
LERFVFGHFAAPSPGDQSQVSESIHSRKNFTWSDPLQSDLHLKTQIVAKPRTLVGAYAIVSRL